MKKCPYCGEEIIDEAKKCRFCKEWLEESPNSTENDPSQTSPADIATADSPSEFGWMKWTCWVAMLFACVDAVQDLGIHSRSDSGIITTLLTFIGDNVPDWLVTIILNTLICTLLIGLRNYGKIRNFVKTPLIALVCLTIGMFFFKLIIDFVGDEEIQAGLTAIFAFPFIIGWSILEFIVGIKYVDSTATRRLGFGFIVYAIVPIFSMIVILGVAESTSEVAMALIEAGALIYFLHELKDTIE